jgi:hypothetical protein
VAEKTFVPMSLCVSTSVLSDFFSRLQCFNLPKKVPRTLLASKIPSLPALDAKKLFLAPLAISACELFFHLFAGFATLRALYIMSKLLDFLMLVVLSSSRFKLEMDEDA